MPRLMTKQLVSTFFVYDCCDEDFDFDEESNQSQTVEQWAQEQTTDKGQAAPVFKLNDETEALLFPTYGKQ